MAQSSTYSLTIDSLASNGVEPTVSFVLSRWGNNTQEVVAQHVIAQHKVGFEDLPQALQRVYSSTGIDPQQIEWMTIVDSQEGHFWNKFWVYRKRARWVESLGLGHLKPYRISPQRALAYEAFRQSGFRQATVICLDPEVNQLTAQLWEAGERGLQKKWPEAEGNSAEEFFERLAEFCGFSGGRAQRQFVELSGYGEPRFLDQLREEWLEIGSQGQLILKDNHPDFARAFHSPQRSPDQPVTSREIDIYASLESLVMEWAMTLKSSRRLLVGGEERICVVGQGLLYEILIVVLPRIFDRQKLFILSGSLSQLRASGASALLGLQQEPKSKAPLSKTPADDRKKPQPLPEGQLA